MPSGGSGRGSFLSGGDQRDQALQKGMSNIQFVAGARCGDRLGFADSRMTTDALRCVSWRADHLRLSPQHVASAHRLYLMASQRSFNIGRKGLVVASACLYAICRRERTPHLLIDFCDVVRYDWSMYTGSRGAAGVFSFV